MTWECHVGDSTEGTYDAILGRYILTALGLNMKTSKHIIESDYGPLKGYIEHLIDLGM